jgi:hypothetical protein
VPRRFGFAVRPGWLAGHVIVLALAVTMVLLGRWQLDVSDSKGFDLQNFGYALQWWAFTIFGIAMWLKILRDHAGAAASSGSMPAVGPAGATVAPDDLSANGPAAAPATTVTPGTVPATTPSSAGYRRYVMPQSSDGPAPAGDAMHAAYNDYLARLAEQSSAEHGTEGTGR